MSGADASALMAMAFSRTMRALAADDGRGAQLALAGVFVLLLPWLWWFASAEVAIYETTEAARLEVDQAVHAIQAPIAGRVIATHLELDRVVEAGEVLVELDASADELRLREEQTRLAGLAPELAALETVIEAEREALAERSQGTQAALEEANARLEEAEEAAHFATLQADRLKQLEGVARAAELDELRARAEAAQRLAAAQALRRSRGRLDWEQRGLLSERRAHLRELEREVVQLQAAIATAEATRARLSHSIERHKIRAPVAGRLGERSPLRVGAVVGEGERLGSIVPTGRVRASADFAPRAALGRIRAGQPARLRLEGFPWTEYGSLTARVLRVGSEAREGKVRVELALVDQARSLIPLQHGLPGSAEVEIDRVSPASLVLRSAGGWLAPASGREPRLR